MPWLLASALLLVWILSPAFKVTVGAIHLLLIAAAVLYIAGLLPGPAPDRDLTGGRAPRRRTGGAPSARLG
jgi:hypothetical protein